MTMVLLSSNEIDSLCGAAVHIFVAVAVTGNARCRLWYGNCIQYLFRVSETRCQVCIKLVIVMNPVLGSALLTAGLVLVPWKHFTVIMSLQLCSFSHSY